MSNVVANELFLKVMTKSSYLETGAVQLLEGRDGVLRHDEGDEGEPLDLLRHPVHRQRHLGERPERAEQRRQVVLGRRVRQVPREQAPCGVGVQFIRGSYPKMGIFNFFQRFTLPCLETRQLE